MLEANACDKSYLQLQRLSSAAFGLLVGLYLSHRGWFLFSAFRSSSVQLYLINSSCTNTPCQKVVVVCISPEEKVFYCTLSLIFIHFTLLCGWFCDCCFFFCLFLWTDSFAKRQSEGVHVWPLCSCVRSAHVQSWCHGVFKDINVIMSTRNQSNYSTLGRGLFYPAPLSHLCQPASMSTTGHEITRAHCRASHAPATHWTLWSLFFLSLMSSFEILL